MKENTCSWYDPSCALAWIRDELQALGLWIWDSLLSGIAATYESIPIPDFMLNVSSHTIPSGVAWAVSPFQLDIGLAIIVGAYLARFILRRIPLIG